jgi:hypothetical protein
MNVRPGRAVPWIADFQAAITSAASITENPHGYDWITRYRAYHRGQYRFPPEARLVPTDPALALPETQAKPVPFDRIILLWAHRSRGQRFKTKVSTRKLALHRALVNEGFRDYWRPLALGGPLFPNVPLDTYGRRISKVTTECSISLRNVVKITDLNKPVYSDRHAVTSHLRNTRLPDGSPAVKEDIERILRGTFRLHSVAAIGAFDGEHFPIIAFRIAATVHTRRR